MRRLMQRLIKKKFNQVPWVGLRRYLTEVDVIDLLNDLNQFGDTFGITLEGWHSRDFAAGSSIRHYPAVVGWEKPEVAQ